MVNTDSSMGESSREGGHQMREGEREGERERERERGRGREGGGGQRQTDKDTRVICLPQETNVFLIMCVPLLISLIS